MASEGKWITVNGRHVFIEDGQSIGDAIKKNKKQSNITIAGNHVSKNIQRDYDNDKKKYNSLPKDVKKEAEKMFIRHWVDDIGAKQRTSDFVNFAKKHNISVGAISSGHAEYMSKIEDAKKMEPKRQSKSKKTKKNTFDIARDIDQGKGHSSLYYDWDNDDKKNKGK